VQETILMFGWFGLGVVAFLLIFIQRRWRSTRASSQSRKSLSK